MKILIIPNNMVNNCFGVRNYLPAKFLSERGHEVRFKQRFEVYDHPVYGKTIDPTDLDWADVVVFNRHYDIGTNTLKNVMKYCKSQGKLVVYETDDLLDRLDPVNPMFQDMKGHIEQVKVMASEASVCTTTGPDIKRELSRYNQNVQILPNCIDEDVWQLRKRGNARLKIGWAGGSSHAADLMIVIDVIKRLKNELDFEFVIFGLADKEWQAHVERLTTRHEEQKKQFPLMKPAAWYEAVVNLAEVLKDLEFTHIPFVKHELYNKTLSELNLDIGLCPIIDTTFNRCKSAIKFYEYAMVGTACLASKIPPYEAEVMYTAKNKFEDWYKKLKTLIINKEMREDLATQQRDWVIKHRNIRDVIKNWEAVYNGDNVSQ